MRKKHNAIKMPQKIQVVEHIEKNLDLYTGQGVAKVAEMINRSKIFDFEITRTNIRQTLEDFDLYDKLIKFKQKRKTDVQAPPKSFADRIVDLEKLVSLQGQELDTLRKNIASIIANKAPRLFSENGAGRP